MVQHHPKGNGAFGIQQEKKMGQIIKFPKKGKYPFVDLTKEVMEYFGKNARHRLDLVLQRITDEALEPEVFKDTTS